VKFRTVFFLFNLIIVLSFAFIFLMPLPILGWAYAVSFWGQNWPIAFVFVAVLAALDGYFLAHWRLYTLLEREDWPGLKVHLEAELARKGRLSLSSSRIYINACLIGQVPSKLTELRVLYMEKKIPYLPQLALSLALPLVLEGQSAEVESFLRPYATNRKTGADGPWIRWSLAFAGLLGNERDRSRNELQNLLGDRLEPALELLSLYLIDTLRASDVEQNVNYDQKKAVLAAGLTDKEWVAHLDKLKETVILVLFMGKLIQDARTWLAAPAPGGTS